MAKALKHLIDGALVRAAARHLRRHWPRFEEQRFVAAATAGLQGLELKQRAMRVADALEQHLPPQFDEAAALIEAALAPPRPEVAGEDAGEGPAVDDAHGDDADDDRRAAEAGLAGWILWPVGEFVARRGLAHPERALQTLHALTQRFTAEFAIRPFIATHPGITFATLARWTRDPSAHVRRLVSEGSRPRLPWGMQLKALVADPTPTLPLLRALQDDPSESVRRSVANHLNDIAKDHPELIADWLARHLPGAAAQRRSLLKHASRTLIKKGDARVLAAWGLGARFRGQASFSLEPARLVLGGSVKLTLALHSAARSAQPLAIDYAVHHVKADGSTSPKVFKGWQLTLAARERRLLEKQHALRPISTRTYHGGRHRVVVQINGRPVAEAAFMLRV